MGRREGRKEGRAHRGGRQKGKESEGGGIQYTGVHYRGKTILITEQFIGSPKSISYFLDISSRSFQSIEHT